MITNGKELIERLISCGFTENNAKNVCEKYALNGDINELKAFVRAQELIYDDRKQYV